MQKKLIIYLIFLLVSINVFATDLMHIKINQFGVIYDVLEFEKQQEIIIASEKGLFIYTGKKIISIKNSKDKAFHKISIMNDSIYVLSFNKNVYKIVNNDLELVFSDKNNESINDFYGINDKILLCFPSKLVIYSNQSINEIFPKQNAYVHGILKHDNINFLFSQSKNKIYLKEIAGDKGFDINFSGKIQKVFLNKSTNFFISNGFIYSIDVCNKSLKKIIEIPKELKNVKIYSIKKIDENNIAIGHNNGFSMYDIKKNAFSHFFKEHIIHSIIQDSFGNIWLGSKFQGLIQIPSKNIFELDIHQLLGINDKVVSSYQKDDKWYLGTNFGKIVVYDLNNNKIQQVKLNNNADVQSFYKKDNYLYAYCDKLYKIDVKSLKIIQTYNVHSTKAIFVDQDIYCATSGDFQNISKQLKTNKGLWHICMYYDKIKKGFYLGTNSGVFFVDKNMSNKPEKLKDNLKIVSIKKINEELRFFGINGVVYDSNFNIIKRHAINKVYNVSQLKPEKYLLYNDYEVLMVNYEVERKLNFIPKITQDNPILNILEFNNDLFILTSDKIYKIKNYHSFIQDNLDETLDLQISSSKKSDKKNQIRLSYKNTKILFELKSNLDLSFFSNYDVHFKINKEAPQKIEANRKGEFILNLNYLPEGNSTITFLLTNKKGESLSEKKISVFVSSPFWKSIWFLSLLFFFVSTAIYFYQKNRIKKINDSNAEKIKKEKLKTKLVKSQLTAIRSQMNPHFVFNTLSTIQLKIAKKETNIAFNLVQKFSSLMRGVLSYSQVEIITLKEELNILKNYIELENQRFNNSINIAINVDKTMNLDDFKIPSLITQPFVENSFQHGLRHKKGNKILQISIKKNSSTSYSVVIEDNGIGIEASNELNKKNSWKKSFAMDAIKKRIQHINSLGVVHVFLKVSSNEFGTKTYIKVNDYD